MSIVEALRARGYHVEWRSVDDLAARGYPLLARDLRARGFAGQMIVSEPPPGIRAALYLVTPRGRLVYAAGSQTLARELRRHPNPLTETEVSRLLDAAAVRRQRAERAAARGDVATAWYESGIASGYVAAPMVASGQWRNPWLPPAERVPANPARHLRPWPRPVVEPLAEVYRPRRPGPVTTARALVRMPERPMREDVRLAARAIERALAHLAGMLGPRGIKRIPRDVEPWEVLMADPATARRARALRRLYHHLVRRYWAPNPRERLGPRARFRPEQLAPPEAFDPRSFRTVIPPGRPDVRVTVGCPVGAWDARRRRCRVGMRPQRILRLRRRSNPVIYDRVEAVWARKGRGRYAGLPFVHTFRTPVRAVGLLDGRVLLEPAP